MPRFALTAAVWVAALLALTIGGLIAALFVVMPTSLGPTEMIEAGVEPWTNALWAGCAFVGLVVVAVVGLAMWQSARLRLVGLALVVAEVAAVAWAATKVYTDYL